MTMNIPTERNYHDDIEMLERQLRFEVMKELLQHTPIDFITQPYIRENGVPSMRFEAAFDHLQDYVPVFDEDDFTNFWLDEYIDPDDLKMWTQDDSDLKVMQEYKRNDVFAYWKHLQNQVKSAA